MSGVRKIYRVELEHPAGSNCLIGWVDERGHERTFRFKRTALAYGRKMKRRLGGGTIGVHCDPPILR